jgi:2'-phosphotransferase
MSTAATQQDVKSSVNAQGLKTALVTPQDSKQFVAAPGETAGLDADNKKQFSASDKGNRSKLRKEKALNTHPNGDLGRTLVKILRHTAGKIGIEVRDDGYAKLSELMAHPSVKKFNPTLESIQQIVQTNDKQRLALKQEDNVWLIRANQGHSQGMPTDDEKLLKPLSLEEIKALKTCEHGSYVKYQASIMKLGLSRMMRKHIHMTKFPFGSDRIVSGARKDANLVITVDAFAAAKEKKIPFYESSNGVILSPGNTDGVIPANYLSFKPVSPAKLSPGNKDGVIPANYRSFKPASLAK